MPNGAGISARAPRRLVLVLALACLLTLVFGLRLGHTVLHWPERRELAVQGWMTVGFVAHAWDLERDRLAAALGVAEGERPTLDAIAARSGRTRAEVAAVVERAIAEAGR